jgi:hypothetical protein
MNYDHSVSEDLRRLSPRFRWFLAAIATGGILSAISIILSLHASSALSDLSHWLIYRNVDFSKVSPETLNNLQQRRELIRTIVGALYILAGPLLSLAIFPWANLKLRISIVLIVLVILLWV